MTVKLLSWNVAGRVKRLVEQAARIIASEPDLVCLQEVTRVTAPQWQRLLPEHGFTYIEMASLTPARAAPGERPLAVLTAARTPLAAIEVGDLPWPERVLSTQVDGLRLINLHSPISARPGLVKVRTHEAVHAHVAAVSGPCVLCGDLNTPRREHPDGSVWTFARTRSGRLRPERGERWDRAELALIKGLEPYGFRDAFRALHGWQAREFSWQWQNQGGGYRLDHLLASAQVTVSELTYLHSWRTDGLSDHSPLLARLRWGQ